MDNIAKILKGTLKPNRICAFLADDNNSALIEKAFLTYFAHKKHFKIIRCKSLLHEIVGNPEQNKFIQEYHTNSNHRGIDETFLHLKRETYFPNMKNKISELIRNCETCPKLKYDRQPQNIVFETPETPTKPLDIIHIDIYTINNNFNLTIIDKFSKFAAVYPIPNRNGINCTKVIKNFFSQFGLPKKLIHDQGVEFCNDIFRKFCSQYNILLHVTSFQQSSSNSPVERLHSSLTEIYRIILDTRKKHKLPTDHEEIMSETVITYNNAIHSTTKHTPFELFNGRTHLFEKTIIPNNEHDYLNKLNTFQDKLYSEIKEKLSTNVQQRTEKLNTSRGEPTTVQPNSTIFRKENRRNKLTPRFSLHRTAKDKGKTLVTTRNQKIHKSKIRKIFKPPNDLSLSTCIPDLAMAHTNLSSSTTSIAPTS